MLEGPIDLLGKYVLPTAVRSRRNPKSRGPNTGEGSSPIDSDGQHAGTEAERTIARFTGALVLVAVVQVAVAALQWQVAQKALWDAQTPHVQLWAEGGGIRQNGTIVPVTFRIRNGSNVTLFNGKVWTRIAVVPVDHPEAVWNSLEYQDSVVMGPDDIEDYPLATGLALTPSQQERLGNGASMVALALKTEFPDSAGRIHHRYICYGWRNEAVRLLRSCPTPPQD